jgi:hypothetical protein
LFCENGLLLGAFDHGSEVDGVGFAELLARDVCELGFGNERLCLCSDKLLLELSNLGAGWLLVLELLQLIGDLRVQV